MVGAMAYSCGATIDIRQAVVDNKGRRTDIDVLAVHGKTAICAYECKGQEPKGAYHSKRRNQLDRKAGAINR